MQSFRLEASLSFTILPPPLPPSFPFPSPHPLTCFAGDFLQHVHQVMMKAGKWSAKRKGDINLKQFHLKNGQLAFIH